MEPINHNRLKKTKMEPSNFTSMLEPNKKNLKKMYIMFSVDSKKKEHKRDHIKKKHNNERLDFLQIHMHAEHPI